MGGEGLGSSPDPIFWDFTHVKALTTYSVDPRVDHHLTIKYSSRQSSSSMGNSRYRFKMNVEGLDYELVFPANNYVRQVIVSVFMLYSFGTVVKNSNLVFFLSLVKGGGAHQKNSR